MLILLLFPCSPAYIPARILPVLPPSPAAPCAHCLLSPYIFLVLPATAQPLGMHRSHSTSWHGVGKNRWGSSPVVLPSFGEAKVKPQLPGCWQLGATWGLSLKAAILIECSVGWGFFITIVLCLLVVPQAPSCAIMLA